MKQLDDFRYFISYLVIGSTSVYVGNNLLTQHSINENFMLFLVGLVLILVPLYVTLFILLYQIWGRENVQRFKMFSTLFFIVNIAGLLVYWWGTNHPNLFFDILHQILVILVWIFFLSPSLSILKVGVSFIKKRRFVSLFSYGLSNGGVFILSVVSMVNFFQTSKFIFMIFPIFVSVLLYRIFTSLFWIKDFESFKINYLKSYEEFRISEILNLIASTILLLMYKDEFYLQFSFIGTYGIYFLFLFESYMTQKYYFQFRKKSV